jgi:hypothetical protein
MDPPPVPVLLPIVLVSVKAPVVSKPIADPAMRPLLFTVVRLPSSVVTSDVVNPLAPPTPKAAVALLKTIRLPAVQSELLPP